MHNAVLKLEPTVTKELIRSYRYGVLTRALSW